MLNGGYIAIIQKADLPEMKDNDMIIRNVRADRNKLVQGKNGGYMLVV